jgi:hypothetical protein
MAVAMASPSLPIATAASGAFENSHEDTCDAKVSLEMIDVRPRTAPLIQNGRVWELGDFTT